jgi:hypothetical protein
MHHSERRKPRAALARKLSLVSALALMFAAVPAGVASAGEHDTWVVEPGQSIQDAVDQASSGDTIQLLAGTYENQAVCIEGKGLTITGAGSDETRITWPDWTVVEDQQAAPEAGNACWLEWARHDPESTTTGTGAELQQSLSDDVSALFFFNPDSPVSVTGLQTVNHPANGIVVETGNDVEVSHTKGVAHDRYGILVSNSTGSRITHNVEQGLDRGIQQEGTSGSSGTAGISVSDSADARAYVAHNTSDGWNLGIFVREARTGALVGNTVTNNCVGINLFDDGNTEVPVVAPSTIEAGAWAVLDNTVTDNHRFCLAGIGQVEGQLAVSGTGVAVVNMDSVLIKGNTITDNGPTPPAQTLDFPAAGLLLLTLPLFNTDQPDAAGPVTDVAVVNNTIQGNITSVDVDGPGPAEPFLAPLDILVGFPPGTVFTDAAGNVVPTPVPGPGIVFSGNSCGVSLLGAGVPESDSDIHIDCGGA